MLCVCVMKEKTVIPSRLVYNACWLIATLVGELAQSASGTEVCKGLVKLRDRLL